VNVIVSDIATSTARGAIVTVLGSAVTAVIVAISSLVIARVLTPAEFGQYTVALIPASISSTVIGWGIDQALPLFLIRSRTQHRESEHQKLIYAGLVVKGLAGVGFALVLVLFAEPIAVRLLNRPEVTVLIQATALAVIANPVYGSLRTSFTGLERMTHRSIVSILQASIRTIISPIAVLLGIGVIGAILGHVSSIIISTAIGLGLLMLIVPVPRPTEILQSLRVQAPAMIRFGFPLFVGALINNLMVQFRVTLLPWFISDLVIGNYRVAGQFSALLGVLTGSLAVTLYPMFSKFRYVEAPHATRQAYLLAVRYSSLIVFPVAMLFMTVSDPMITTLYGNQYPLAAGYLAILVAPSLLMGLGLNVTVGFLTSQGDRRSVITLLALRSGFALGLAPVGLIVGGVPGFIFSLLVAHVIEVIYAISRLRLQYQIHFNYRHTVLLFVSTLMAAGGSWIVTYLVIGLPSVLTLVLGTAVFGILVLLIFPLIRVVTPEDLQFLQRLAGDMFGVGQVLRIIVGIEERLMR
jgi:O-antigen/teichoic acid export membrane protein